ncbi:MAG: hypothetical protein J6O49_05910 [Bacteroidaceae bacterium]|nr:hypothetical protein [Bacteroidaceae bacterium]
MSSDRAKSYHSITIGEKNTWDDWHLVPTSRPLVAVPQIKTHFVDIPGGDGQLDLTTALTGRPLYGNRSGSWEFLVMNGYQSWELLYSDILNYLHGQAFKAILDDDPDYYYEGRFSLNEWRSQKDWSRITINYNLAPYKFSVEGTTGDNWLWNTFNFETGVIRSYKDIQISGSGRVAVVSEKMTVVSEIITSASGMKVTWKGATYNLNQGTNKISKIKMETGVNYLDFTGTGKVTIVVNEGKF